MNMSHPTHVSVTSAKTPGVRYGKRGPWEPFVRVITEAYTRMYQLSAIVRAPVPIPLPLIHV